MRRIWEGLKRARRKRSPKADQKSHARQNPDDIVQHNASSQQAEEIARDVHSSRVAEPVILQDDRPGAGGPRASPEDGAAAEDEIDGIGQAEQLQGVEPGGGSGNGIHSISHHI